MSCRGVASEKLNRAIGKPEAFRTSDGRAVSNQSPSLPSLTFGLLTLS